MKWFLGLAVAVAVFAFSTGALAQQCNRSNSQSSSSPGSFGSLSTQPNSSLYSYSGNSTYVPTAQQLTAYNNAAMYQAMLSQRMDRLAQMEMVNQIAAQRAALRKAQKEKKEAQKEKLYTAGR
jgi:hypothetical protein